MNYDQSFFVADAQGHQVTGLDTRANSVEFAEKYTKTTGNTHVIFGIVAEYSVDAPAVTETLFS